MRFQKLRFYTPDHSHFSWLRIIGKIGRNWVPIIPDNSWSPTHLPDYSRFFPIFPNASGLVKACLAREAFPAGAVTPLVLHCRTHALLLTIAKVNIVSTSLKVTLRKLVMTRVFCGTRRAAIANWWRRHDRTAMFCRRANTWLIIAKTDSR